MHKHKLFFIGAIVLFLVAGFALATRAADFSQGFEITTAGWTGVGGSSVERVASGTNGITSSEGAYHGLLKVGNIETEGVYLGETLGPRTDWGGFGATFPEDGYVTQIDVYLDPALADGNDRLFNFSSSINDPSGAHRRDFVFNVVAIPGAVGSEIWLVDAGTIVKTNSEDALEGEVIGTAGWYTLRQSFMNNGAGVLKVVMDLLNSDGLLLRSWVVSNPTDIIGATVGGSGYGWFVTNSVEDLPVDNAIKVGGDTLVNGPETEDDCKDGGWGTFTDPSFRNQGDCVSYVQANENAEGNIKDNE